MKFYSLLLMALITVPVSLTHAQTAAAPATEIFKEKSWLLEDEKNTISTFTRNADAVVFVNTKTFVRDFFSMDVYEVPSGAGTGFVWDQDGHIVTNYTLLRTTRATNP